MGAVASGRLVTGSVASGRVGVGVVVPVRDGEGVAASERLVTKSVVSGRAGEGVVARGRDGACAVTSASGGPAAEPVSSGRDGAGAVTSASGGPATESPPPGREGPRPVGTPSGFGGAAEDTVGNGRRASNSAPPPAASVTVNVPSCLPTACRTRASPSPRPPGPDGLVDQPRWKTASAWAGATPAPVSATRSTSPSASVNAVTVTRAPVVPCAASTALSMRFPRTVTRSRAESESGRSPSSMALSWDTTSSTPRSLACAALPSSSAARTGSLTAATTWSVSVWASSSSAVAKSTASSARSSSMSDTTVWRRFAASCACERSARVKPRSESNSPIRDWSSVTSRKVTTVPRRSPPETGEVFTTSTRSAVRWTSSTRGSAESSAPVSGAGSPSSATERPTTSPLTPSSSRPPSLISATLNCPSSISSPSRTACSAAWW